MKWYDQILQSVKALLGLENEATESEVHAALQETETRDAIVASIRTELETEHQQALAERDETISELQTGLDETNRLLDAANTRIAALETENTELRERVPDEHTDAGGEGATSNNVQLDPVTKAHHERYVRQQKK